MFYNTKNITYLSNKIKGKFFKNSNHSHKQAENWTTYQIISHLKKKKTKQCLFGYLITSCIEMNTILFQGWTGLLKCRENTSGLVPKKGRRNEPKLYPAV